MGRNFPSTFYEYVRRTPLVAYHGSSPQWQELYIKDETQQVAHSFKFRGNFQRLLAETSGSMVVTSSTGNHGIGMSTAAQILGLKAHVFVPTHTSQVKIQALADLNAIITRVDGGYDECTEEAKRFAAREGCSYISSLDDPAVVTGHSSLFHEVSEQDEQGFQTVFVPVGGGGLLAGCLIQYQGTGVHIVGVELAGVPSMKRALETGERVLLPPMRSVAEGMLVRRAGELPFHLAHNYPSLEIVLVSEEQIRDAMRLVWQYNQIRAEGAGVAALAAALAYQATTPRQRAMAVISGGNIDDATFQDVLSLQAA